MLWSLVAEASQLVTGLSCVAILAANLHICDIGAAVNGLLTLLLFALLLLCRGQLAAAADELSEHRELQMTHNKLCCWLRLPLFTLLLLCRGQLAAAAEELSEHRELQMTHDKLCQDVYRMRMMLQQAQSHGNDVAQVCCFTRTFLQGVRSHCTYAVSVADCLLAVVAPAWHRTQLQPPASTSRDCRLMQDHRRQVAEAHTATPGTQVECFRAVAAVSCRTLLQPLASTSRTCSGSCRTTAGRLQRHL
jgi:hypothetical protein